MLALGLSIARSKLRSVPVVNLYLEVYQNGICTRSGSKPDCLVDQDVNSIPGCTASVLGFRSDQGLITELAMVVVKVSITPRLCGFSLSVLQDNGFAR